MAKPKPKSAATRKKVPYMKMGHAEVSLHLEPRGGKVTLCVSLPKEISKILARRLKRRV